MKDFFVTTKALLFPNLKTTYLTASISLLCALVFFAIMFSIVAMVETSQAKSKDNPPYMIECRFPFAHHHSNIYKVTSHKCNEYGNVLSFYDLNRSRKYIIAIGGGYCEIEYPKSGS